MTHRILSPFKSIALFAAFRFGSRRAKSGLQILPEPIRRTLEPNQVTDEWMFGTAETPVREEATLYAREMGRASGSLSHLRALLTQIVPHAPVVDTMPVMAPFGPMESDDVLFDGEAMAATYGDVPFEDADLFEERSTQFSVQGADEAYQNVA
ncbi:MAG: hypothetical protein ACRBEQ_02455 [Hyphomonas sp.]